MALNVAVQAYRGTRANLATLASTGKAGVLAWTTDTNEVYVDSGSGSGIGTAWLRIANDVTVQAAANQAARLALTANIGDVCTQTDNNTTYILIASPPSVNGNWSAIGLTALANIPESAVTNLVTDLAAAEKTANKNAASGYAGLDAGSKIAAAQLPSVIDCGTF